jgi:KipI family sensor histidine kinase inhibitor
VNDYRIVAAGDSALLLEFEARIDPVVNARVIAVAESIQDARIAGVRDVVPTYCSVAVFFDPLRTRYDALVACLEQSAGRPFSGTPDVRAPVRIPVCYGGEFGPDLSEVARFARTTEDDVVVRHTRPIYHVYMLGFVPGFAYMGLVDSRIAATRLATPRIRVEAGSVGIAGAQTGIYPASTPGGWQLIGRTPVKPFDPARGQPFLFRAGDAVQFYSVGRDDYDRLHAHPEAIR